MPENKYIYIYSPDYLLCVSRVDDFLPEDRLPHDYAAILLPRKLAGSVRKVPLRLFNSEVFHSIENAQASVDAIAAGLRLKHVTEAELAGLV